MLLLSEGGKITMAGTDYRMWIGGEWCESASKESIDSINPATSEVIGYSPGYGS